MAVHAGEKRRATEEGKTVPTRLWRLAPDSAEIVLETPDYSGLLTKSERGQLLGIPLEFAISPDGRSLVTVSSIFNRLEFGGGWEAGTVLELWDLEKRTRIANLLDRHQRQLRTANVDMSPDGRLLAMAAGGEGISIRDLSSGKEIRLIENRNSVLPLKFSPDGKHLFSGGSFPRDGGESPILVFDVASGRKVGEWNGHRGGVLSLALSADGTMLASGGSDRLICLWDTRTGRKLACWEAHQGEVSALAITRDAGTLVSGGSDGALKLWDLAFIRKELSSLGLGW